MSNYNNSYLTNQQPHRKVWLLLRLQNSYTFKLSGQAIANFSEMQQLLAQQQRAQLKFTISSGLLDIPEDARTVTLTARLKLAEQSDYLTLFENAKLTLEHSD